jgi:hypothetical protein
MAAHRLDSRAVQARESRPTPARASPPFWTSGQRSSLTASPRTCRTSIRGGRTNHGDHWKRPNSPCALQACCVGAPLLGDRAGDVESTCSGSLGAARRPTPSASRRNVAAGASRSPSPARCVRTHRGPAPLPPRSARTASAVPPARRAGQPPSMPPVPPARGAGGRQHGGRGQGDVKDAREGPDRVHRRRPRAGLPVRDRANADPDVVRQLTWVRPPRSRSWPADVYCLVSTGRCTTRLVR